jgi:hypothetical protein
LGKHLAAKAGDVRGLTAAVGFNAILSKLNANEQMLDLPSCSSLSRLNWNKRTPALHSLIRI